jgi:DNA-binding CsgD family transcriptional regulator
MTARRLDVLVRTAQGFTDTEIGAQLGLAAPTVRMHRQHTQLLLRRKTRDDIVSWGHVHLFERFAADLVALIVGQRPQTTAHDAVVDDA